MRLTAALVRPPSFPFPINLCFSFNTVKKPVTPGDGTWQPQTLEAMRQGGIYDQIGFGFHRYSTDQKWLIPHFEKMLYDQALMAMANLEAFQAIGQASFSDTAREIFTYVLRDMTDPSGGFYCAEDADSEGEEGKFYVWTAREIRQTLTAEEGPSGHQPVRNRRGGKLP